ncbi:MAG: glycosyltransferase family protein [Desulforhopalus sp.]
MKVSYYCQHVLGIGHFHRSLAICREIARRHSTTLILGGPPVEVDHPSIEVLRLPGLQMDSEFNSMVPCAPNLSLDEVKSARKNLLFNHFKEGAPDVFITELYPLGRKAFRFELDPVLEAIDAKVLPPCLCYCSVRDILVEKKTGREKFEDRAVKTLNRYYNGVLIHADPQVITLEKTFGRLDDINIPLHYTGFVSQQRPDDALQNIRSKFALKSKDKLIVASIGGGNVGSELLFATIDAFNCLESTSNHHLQIFSGPYCDEATYIRLQERAGTNITLQRFTDHFPQWLEVADLSISMAGYNTCMNLIQAGIPALVYPFDQNREQRLRAEQLGKKSAISVLDDQDLQARALAQHMLRQFGTPRSPDRININGAEETAAQLKNWFIQHSHHG